MFYKKRCSALTALPLASLSGSSHFHTSAAAAVMLRAAMFLVAACFTSIHAVACHLISHQHWHRNSSMQRRQREKMGPNTISPGSQFTTQQQASTMRFEIPLLLVGLPSGQRRRTY
jgi:hypothetical protein